ncbi:DUF2497 domain-containing protein [Roseomonas stagni]|uniref:DUF2497 domain-containing protein n=2 Tax=Falsiroseomonas algicola TaxID=2716930 RepID=A0A6M1LPA8_9PROT|nr:DUF2497 domain-containing protein [Falsiroseomonas algicola]
MSGAAGKPGGPQGGPQGADPAMDDILASIRRILNEDETPATPSSAPPAEPLELTEAMLVASPPPPEPAPPAAEPPPAPTHVSLPAEPEPEGPPQPLPAAAPVIPADGLIAPAVAAATTAALGQLLRSVAAERQAPVYRGGPSIEDVVREELRPLLKEWLDQHLPPLVERLVRAEIERVVGRALP